MSHKLLVVILLSISVSFMAACSGGGNSGNSIVIAFTQAPPAALQTSAQTPVSATVSGSSNTGVDWTVACGGADCGSISPAHTDSGAATTYTAPASIPTGNTVTITATASASSSATVSGAVTITSGSTNSALNGQYAFVISGFDGNGNYVAAGSIIADGNGNITQGEEDFCDLSTKCFVALLGGTFSSGPDGRGSIVLTSSSFSSAQILQFVLTSSSHALITEFDTFATSSGALDLQDPNALDASTLTGGFSMVLNGVDIQLGGPGALGAVMTADGSGDFNNVTLDLNDGGSVTTGTTSLAVQSGPDSFGRVSVSDGTFLFAYYIINAKAARVIELDDNFLQATGVALTQGAGSLTVANLAGNSIFTEAGTSVISNLGQLGLAGEFTANNSGSVSAGFMDVNDDGSVTNGSIAGSALTGFASGRGDLTLGGTVSSDVTEFEVYLVDSSVNILDPTSSTGGGGALLLDIDANAVGTGAIIPQAATPQFNGDYGINLQAISSTDQNLSEIDLVGQVTSDGAGNLTGTGDLNNFGATLPSATLTGTFTADGSHAGRYTDSLMISGFDSLSFVYYQASNSQIVVLEVDNGSIGTGVLLQQQ